MSPKIELLKEKKDFNNAWKLINNSFDVSKTLPIRFLIKNIGTFYLKILT